MDYTQVTIIVSKESQVSAQELTNPQYFITALSETGKAPATYFITSGPFGNDELDILVNSNVEKKVFFGSNWQAAIEKEGLKIISEDSSI